MRIYATMSLGLFLLLHLNSTTFAGDPQSGDASVQNWRDSQLRNINIELDPVEGVYYESEAPATLDLAEKAELCINAMTRLVNPDYDYAQYSYVVFRHDPPYMAMETGITNLNPKWLESLPLMRIMTGSRRNVDIDARIVEGVLRNTGFDGLTYQPPDHPGAFYDDFTRNRNKPAADITGESRQLIWLSIMNELTQDPTYRNLGDRKIGRLLEIAASKDDTLYFRRGRGYTPGEKDADKVDIMAITDHEVSDPKLGVVGTASARTEGSVAMGAARYYLATGHPAALELARGTAEYFRKHARVIDDSGKWHGWHFHVLARALIGVVEYGIVAEDRDMLRWARRAYEYGRSIGDPTLGFFAGIPSCDPCEFNPIAKQCGMDHARLETEPCSISDMAIIALKLTDAGMGDYYEDVEHYVRNLMVESQITSTDFLEDFPKEISQSTAVKGVHDHHQEKLGLLFYDNVAERGVGSFCNSRPNGWHIGAPGPTACGCCVGNVARGFYYIWDSIIQSKGQHLKVNLLLNRASPWADLDSHLPYEGKVVLKMKEKKNVSVRIPDWTNKKAVTCRRNGIIQDYEWRGNYIHIESLKPDDELVIQFPISERLVYRNLKGTDYWMTVRGFTVVDLKPQAEVTPIFQREHYRRSSAPTKKVTRFVSNQRITW